jgi:hypothetical protein
MEWVKLAAVPAYYIDGALLRAGEPAEVLFCRALAHCGGVESAGLVDKTVLPMLVTSRVRSRAAALVREGLWIDEGTHYRIRSWDKWQDEHDAAAERRRKDRERKRQKRRESAEDVAGTSADIPQDVSSASAECPALEGEGDVEGERTSSSRTRKRATAAPDDFQVTDSMKAWWRENCPLVTDPVAETRQFLDHARANGKVFKDWQAAWRTWMANAQKFAGQRGGNVRALPSRQMPPGANPHMAHLWEQG